MTYHILYNPMAGDKNSQSKAAELPALQGATCVYHDITSITDYAALFADLGSENTLVLCGGDGTINRFINDTADLTLPCSVMYFASGSGNDFMTDVKTEDGQTFLCLDEYIKDLPTVELNGKAYRFINGIGYGIDGYCCEVGDKQKLVSDKPVNYTAIAIKGLLFHYKPCNATVTVDGKEYHYPKVWIAATMKGRYYGGGMMAAPGQDRHDKDGKVTLLVWYGSGSLRTLMAFPSIFKGEHIKHTKMVAVHEGHDITVTFDKPTPLQIDGETHTDITSYRVLAKAPAKV